MKINKLDIRRCQHCHKKKKISDFYYDKYDKLTSPNCKSCIKVDRKIYYRENKENISKKAKRYYLKNKVQHRRKCKEWYENHKEYIKEYNKKYHVKYKDKIRKNQRKYYNKNKEYITKYIKNWKIENYDRVRLHGRTREARLRASIGSFNIREWLDLCDKYDDKCVCCGKKRKLTVDHVIPISKGGTSYISNIQPLCGKCNNRKRNKIKDYRKK